MNKLREVSIKTLIELTKCEYKEVFITDVTNEALPAMVDLAKANGFKYIASISGDVFAIVTEEKDKPIEEPVKKDPDVSNNAINLAVRSVIMNTLTSDKVSGESARTLYELVNILQQINTIPNPKKKEKE